MSEVKVFNNEKFGAVRTMVLENEPWFVGKDVAEILGYKNPNEAIADHVDQDDKFIRSARGSEMLKLFNSVKAIQDEFGRQDNWFINESGLYSLIFGSKLESAKEFKHWVTSEVLPSIRKTGSYRTKHMDPDEAEIKKMRCAATLNNSLARKAKELYKLIESTGVDAHRNVLVVYSANMLAQKEILELPAVERTFTASYIAEQLGISANKVGRIANRLGLKAEAGGENEYGRWVADVAKGNKNKQVEAWRYNQTGIEAIRQELSREGA